MTSINIGDFGTATSTAGAATVNHTEGQITTESLSTAQNADYSFTLTNNCIYAGSIVIVQAVNGTNTTAPIYAHSVVPAAGSATFKVRNACATATALNGTILLNFVVL